MSADPRSETALRAALEEYVRALDAGERERADLVLERIADPGERARFSEWIGELETLRRWMPEPAEVPGRIGAFTVEREIGRGGMGVVHLGRDARGRAVAIKMLPDDSLPEDPAARRFEREIAVLRSLDHPAIVRVLEHRVERGRRYLVMEHLGGGSLADRIHARRADPRPRGDVEVREACRVVAQVARAVAAAHARGVVHRDVKPSNVLFDDDGHPRLADFGLAHLEHASTLTTVDRLIGTAAYLAPERSIDPARAPDVRVDVYSLGVTLFEAITGSRPFQGSLPEILAAARRGTPSARPYLGHSLDRDLRAVLDRCLAWAPELRYASAGALADDLEAWLARRPVAARRGARRRRLALALRRRPVASAAMLLGALLATTWLGLTRREALAAEREVGVLLADAHANARRFGELVESIGAQVATGATRFRDEWRLSSLAALGETESFEIASAAGVAPGLRGDERARLLRDARELIAFREDLERRRKEARTDLEAAEGALQRAQIVAGGDRRVLAALADLHRTAARWCTAEGNLERAEEHWRHVARLESEPRGGLPTASLELRVVPADALFRLLRYDTTAGGPWRARELSPWRPVGPRTTVAGLAPGSYVVELARAQDAPSVRYPVVLGRDVVHRTPRLELPPVGTLDEDWVWVPPGVFSVGGDPRAASAEPAARRWVDGFQIARHEVTCGEYLEFLRDLHAHGESCRYQPREAYARLWKHDLPVHVPREGLRGGPRYDADDIIDGPRDPAFAADRAIHGISPLDALHFARWVDERAERAGEPWTYALPTGDEWEKAARGADARTFPWGVDFDWRCTAGGHSVHFDPELRTGGAHYLVPGSVPQDVSPYGVLDMAGNVREACADLEPLDGRYLVRGGAHDAYAPDEFRLAARQGAAAGDVRGDLGIRLVRRRRE